MCVCAVILSQSNTISFVLFPLLLLDIQAWTRRTDTVLLYRAVDTALKSLGLSGIAPSTLPEQQQQQQQQQQLQQGELQSQLLLTRMDSDIGTRPLQPQPPPPPLLPAAAATAAATSGSGGSAAAVATAVLQHDSESDADEGVVLAPDAVELRV